MNTTFWQAILYLHLVAMAFFLGGQLMLGRRQPWLPRWRLR